MSKPLAVGAHVTVQLYDGRVFDAVVKAIHETCAGRKVAVSHQAMSWRLDAGQILRIRTARDAEWSQSVLGVNDKVLTPEQGAEWLKKDRIQRARNVSEARRLRGPVRW
ncbi:MAG TPA: hypothetical protein VKQ28_15730 [Candidatus Acidoferrum sp.]|nr:hypothetical protein [Candidatus Acidoferrum sp.]